jgi:hypothetical protein
LANFETPSVPDFTDFAMAWTLAPATDFARHIDDWRGLNRALGDNPALDPGFIAPLLDHFGTGRELLAARHSEGKVDAMTILSPAQRGSWQTFQPSQAPLGLWISDPGRSLEDLAGSLLQALPGFPLLLGIMQLDPEMLARPSDSGCLRTLDYIQTARITTPGSFDAYWEARGKNLRHNIKRQLNRIARESIDTRLVAHRQYRGQPGRRGVGTGACGGPGDP